MKGHTISLPIWWFVLYAMALMYLLGLLYTRPALNAHAEQMDKTIDLLIVELFEKDRALTICEEAVGRWTTDARTRQEVKNEARRLKERSEGK